MSNLIDFAKSELARLRGPADELDEVQDAIEANVMEIVGAFAAAGHSGTSAPYTIGILSKLLSFEPLTPLTGAEDEWDPVESGYGVVAQNKRCSRVFKRADGTAFDIQAVVFREPTGAHFTSRDSQRDVTFPYVPTTEIVDRPADAA